MVDEKKLSGLMAASRKAYDAEVEGDWQHARQLHIEATSTWTAFRKTAKALTTHDRFYKRMAIKRIQLHQERINSLQASCGSVLAHPSLIISMAGLFGGTLPLSESDLTQESIESRLPLMMHEVYRRETAALSSYTSSLPEDGIAEYALRRTYETGIGMKDQVVVTIMDSTQRCTLLILDAWCEPGAGLSEARAYRAADFPEPAFTIRPAETDICGIAPFRTSIGGFREPGHHVEELPDRIGRSKSYSRFTFGGRRFVRKRQKVGGTLVDAIYEHTTTFPKEGSKTGKLDDDALERKLFWFEWPRNFIRSTRDSWKVFAVRGLDTILLEYLLTMTMFRMVVESAGAIASTTLTADVGDEQRVGAELGKTLAQSVLSNVIGLLG